MADRNMQEKRVSIHVCRTALPNTRGMTLSVISAVFPVCAFLTGCAQKEAVPAKETARNGNIVLITLDTTRADHLGCYGGARKTGNAPKTPNLDEFAARGTRFDDAVAQV